MQVSFALKNKAVLFAVICFFCLAFNAGAQVIINEVASAGNNVLADEDGEYNDFIELYNAGANPVNLLDYSIARLEDNNNKWKFPAVTIQPYSLLTVFASQKDRKTIINHWEKTIGSNEVWRYYADTDAPQSSWAETGYDDSAWQQGQGGFGNGDGDDSTVIPSVYSLYLRKTFSVADTSKIAMALLSIDYDDAFTAYLNGVEIAHSLVAGYTPDPNQPAQINHEAQVYQGGKPEIYKVKRENLALAILPGTNVLAIQVQNVDTASGDLTAIPDFYLAVKDASVTYPLFPSNLSGLHTDFDLASSGQIVVLKDASENIIAMDTIPAMQINHSRGRTTDGGNTWCLFGLPTPGSSNNSSVCSGGYAGVPAFSINAGFYAGTQSLTLSSSAGETIRYSNDGSIPDVSSTAYTSAINLDSTQVIRARCFSSGNLLPGETMTNTYFINEEITMPVVSVTTNSENLWDWNTGLFAMGPDANTEAPFEGANFWKSWEKPGHVEYFDKTGEQGFELNSGLKISGNYTKAFPQKSLRVVARDKYGSGWVDYKLFSGRDYPTLKNFVIRNGGNDWNTVHFRDGLMHRTVKGHTHFDIMERESCVAFLNGQYWGVYELRERQDKNFLESLHGINPDKIDLLEMNGDVTEGSNTDFLNMAAFIANNDMQVTANYDSVKNMFDLDNFVDYFSVEIYANNRDWLITNVPGADPSEVNNIRYWRTNNPVGKWRYILWDLDVTTGLYGLYYENSLQSVLNATNPHSIMLKKLLNNTEFKTYFINRYADLLNTIFVPANINKNANDIHDEMAPEMARHFEKWGNTYPNSISAASSYDIPTWEENIGRLMYFTNYRPTYARNHIQSQFSLINQVDVTLDVSPPGAGTVKISTVVPDSLPWTGVYFDGNPVTITATPNPGYKFSYWKSGIVIPTADSTASITLNINSDDTLRAYFELTELEILAYPNPFKGDITIVYSLPTESKVSLNLYAVTGKRVAEITSPSQTQQPGQHQLTLSSATYTLSHGIYFLKFETGDYSKTIKLAKISD